jgi:hypothetical protein
MPHPRTTTDPRPARLPALRPPTGHTARPAAPAATLVIAARADQRGLAAADALAAALRATGSGDTDSSPGTVITAHAGTADLAHRVMAAEHVYVLDPGRVRACLERFRAGAGGPPSPLGAPARTAHRLALLALLRDRRSRVRWITTRADCHQLLAGPARPRGRAT